MAVGVARGGRGNYLPAAGARTVQLEALGEAPPLRPLCSSAERFDLFESLGIFLRR